MMPPPGDAMGNSSQPGAPRRGSEGGADASGAQGMSNTKMADLPVRAVASETPAAGSGSTPFAAGPSVPSLTEGRIVAGRFQVRHLLGRGGMGEVYAAYDQVENKTVALKVLHPHLLSSPEARERFRGEARMASSLSHPNIVRVHGLHEADGFTLLSMELLSGTSLRGEIDARRRAGGRIGVDEALQWGRQAAEALSYAHQQQIVHRDVKPENLWLTEDRTIKVMDFGIARVSDGSHATSGQTLGSAYYMAPEQLRRQDVDARADQYALAVVLYELFTGELPHGAVHPPRRMRREVSLPVSQAIMRALEVDRTKRFATLDEFRSALASRAAFPLKLWQAVGASVLTALLLWVLVWAGLTWRRSALAFEAARDEYIGGRPRLQLLQEEVGKLGETLHAESEAAQRNQERWHEKVAAAQAKQQDAELTYARDRLTAATALAEQQGQLSELWSRHPVFGQPGWRLELAELAGRCDALAAEGRYVDALERLRQAEQTAQRPRAWLEAARRVQKEEPRLRARLKTWFEQHPAEPRAIYEWPEHALASLPELLLKDDGALALALLGKLETWVPAEMNRYAALRKEALAAETRIRSLALVPEFAELNQEASDLLRQGDDAFSGGDAAAAARSVQQLAERSRNLPEIVRGKLAAIAATCRRLSEADQAALDPIAEIVLKAAPDSAETFEIQGWSALHRKEASKALDAFLISLRRSDNRTLHDQQEAVRGLQSALLREALNLANSLPKEKQDSVAYYLVDELGGAGLVGEAIRFADGQTPSRRVSAYRQLVRIQWAKGNQDGARQTLKALSAFAQGIEGPSDRESALGEVVSLQAELGLFTEAHETLIGLKNSESIRDRLRTVIEAQVKAGKQEDAHRALIAWMERSSDSDHRDRCLQAAALLQIEFGASAAAVATIDRLSDTWKIEPLWKLATVQASHGKKPSAEESLKRARGFAEAWGNSHFLMMTSNAFAEAGLLDEARAIAEGISEPESREPALRHVAAALRKSGKTEAAAELMKAALEVAAKIDAEKRYWTIYSLVDELVQAGDFDSALKAAELDASNRCDRLVKIAGGQFKAGKADDARRTLQSALEVAKSTTESESRSSRLYSVVDGLTSLGFEKEALEAAELIPNSSTRTSAWFTIAEFQRKPENGRVRANQTLELALSRAVAIADEKERVSRVCEIAQKQVEWGLLAAAEATLEKVPAGARRAYAFCLLAQAYVERKDQAAAKQRIELALRELRASPAISRNEHLADVLDACSSAGFVHEVLLAIRTLPADGSPCVNYYYVGTILSGNGFGKDSVPAAGYVPWDRVRLDALCDVAELLAKFPGPDSAIHVRRLTRLSTNLRLLRERGWVE